jgi:hypothetical protein
MKKGIKINPARIVTFTEKLLTLENNTTSIESFNNNDNEVEKILEYSDIHNAISYPRAILPDQLPQLCTTYICYKSVVATITTSYIHNISAKFIQSFIHSIKNHSDTIFYISQQDSIPTHNIDLNNPYFNAVTAYTKLFSSIISQILNAPQPIIDLSQILSQLHSPTSITQLPDGILQAIYPPAICPPEDINNLAISNLNNIAHIISSTNLQEMHSYIAEIMNWNMVNFNAWHNFMYEITFSTSLLLNIKDTLVADKYHATLAEVLMDCVDITKKEEQLNKISDFLIITVKSVNETINHPSTYLTYMHVKHRMLCYQEQNVKPTLPKLPSENMLRLHSLDHCLKVNLYYTYAVLLYRRDFSSC